MGNRHAQIVDTVDSSLVPQVSDASIGRGGNNPSQVAGLRVQEPHEVILTCRAVLPDIGTVVSGDGGG